MTEAPRGASSPRIVLMLVLGGIVLALGGCALFATAVEARSTSALLLVLAFANVIAGALAFVVGVIWAIIRWINNRRIAKLKEV